jgi:small subunit ribosomal protein S10
MTDTKKDNVSKLRIIVSAFEHKVLDKTVADILNAVAKLEVETKGPIPLPTKTKR